MKMRKILSSLLAASMVLSTVPATALAAENTDNIGSVSTDTAAAAAATADLANVENWITDRTEPAGFQIQDGKISFSVKEEPGEDSWRGWQGRKAYTEAEVSSYWKVSYTMDVTASMLEKDNVNASLWIQVDEAGENGAESQKDCVDWAIIQFINQNSAVKLQAWDSKGSGTWKDVNGTVTEGTYTVDVEFANGYLTQYINGTEVNSYDIGVTETAPAAVIAQGRSYGEAFDVSMGVPTISTVAPKEVYIDSSEDLVDAIKCQQDGQTWIFTEAGEYDAFNSAYYAEDKAGLSATNQKIGGYVAAGIEGNAYEYVFPIYVDGLTITKDASVTGDVILTSSALPSENYGGMWNYQNFITISGSKVTIDGVDIQSNRNLYYGTCNKAIELYGANAKDFTLTNVDIIPVENSEGTSFGGSIYFNVTDAGTASIKNVTMDAWISASVVTAGAIAIDGLTQDFSNSEYAGYSYGDYGYAWNPGVTGTYNGITVNNYTVIVDSKTKLAEQIFNSELRDGTVVELKPGTYELDENQCIILNKKVTIQGSGAETVIAGSSSVDYGNGMFTFAGGSEGSAPFPIRLLVPRPLRCILTVPLPVAMPIM